MRAVTSIFDSYNQIAAVIDSPHNGAGWEFAAFAISREDAGKWVINQEINKFFVGYLN